MTDFSANFLVAVVDLLLPGLPALGQDAVLPSASEVAVDKKLLVHLEKHAHRLELSQILSTIAETAGGFDSFIAMDQEVGANFVRNVEAAYPGAFQALLS